MKMFHDNPSIGGPRQKSATFEKAAAKYHWTDIRQDVGAFVDACQKCSQVKARTTLPIEGAHPLPVPEALYSSVSVDWFKLPETPTGFNRCGDRRDAIQGFHQAACPALKCTAQSTHI